MAINVTSILNNNAKYSPESTIKLTWTADPLIGSAQVIITNKTDNKVVVDSGRFFTGLCEYTVNKAVLSLNKQYIWKVRVWSSNNVEMSPWSSKASFSYENVAINLLPVKGPSGNINVRVVQSGKGTIQGVRTRVNDTSQDVDVVEMDSEYASPVRININGTQKSLAAYPGDLAPSYGNHTQSGYLAYNNFSDSGYSAYTDFSNTGYAEYTNHTESGYTAYSDYSTSGYDNHANSGYNNHQQSGYAKTYKDGVATYSDRIDTGYNNHSNSGYNNFSRSGYTKYSNFIDSGYSAGYSNFSRSGYTKYDNFSRSGYAQYSNHGDTINNLS